MLASWDYLWTAVRTHPFNFFYLLIIGVFSALAFIVSLRSLKMNRRQAEASRTQAGEATLSRQLNEKTLTIQAEALRAQGDDTSKALAIAERSAKAAEESVRTALTALETAERPWVIVSQVMVVQRDESNRAPMLVKTVFKNSGRMPALYLEVAQWTVLQKTWWSLNSNCQRLRN